MAQAATQSYARCQAKETATQDRPTTTHRLGCVTTIKCGYTTCGERYYDRRTIRYLEDVEQSLKEGKAQLQEVGKVLIYE